MGSWRSAHLPLATRNSSGTENVEVIKKDVFDFVWDT